MCAGRGRGLFGRPHHDAGLIQEQMGPLPVTGFFCNGELGPVGGQNFCMDTPPAGHARKTKTCMPLTPPEPPSPSAPAPAPPTASRGRRDAALEFP